MISRLLENNALRKLSIIAFVSLLTASIVMAATIPFFEDFTDTTYNDDTQTTADWDTSAGTVSLGEAESISIDDMTYAEFGAGADTNHEARGITLGDFDKDGDLDAAVAVKNSANLLYLSNAGVFDTAPIDLGTDSSNTFSIASADLDHDGDIDIVAANRSKPSVVYVNDGSGSFTEMDVNDENHKRWAIRLVDVEGDGDLDIVESLDNGNGDMRNRISFSRVAEAGAFEFKDSVPIAGVAVDTRALAFGDVNGDGLIDLVTGDHNDGNDPSVGSPNHLHVGDGLGGLATGVQIQPSENWLTFSIELGDLDGDGDLDIIEGNHPDANGLGGETRIYWNDGSGSFSTPTLVTGSDATHKTVALLVEDFDNDGDLDILEGNNNSLSGDATVGQPKRLFINDGGGTFGTVVDITPPEVERTYALAAGDLNDDGILDFVSANQTYDGPVGNEGSQPVQGHTSAYTVSGNSDGTATQLTSEVVSKEFSGVDGRRIKLDVDATIPTSASIDFYVSNDGGDTWIPSWTNNRTTDIGSTNNDSWMWRAVLSSRSPAELPTINEVTVGTGASGAPNFIGPDTVSGPVNSTFDDAPVLNFTDANGDTVTCSVMQVKDGAVVDLPTGTGISVDQDSCELDGILTSADKAEYNTLTAAGQNYMIRAFGYNGAMTGTSASDGDIIVTIENSAGVSAPVATNVSIVGTSEVGATLTGVYTYSDGQNNPEGDSTFRWLRDGTAIADATEVTYTTTNDDAETMIQFEVTPVATSGGSLVGNAVTSAEFAVDAIVDFAPTAGELNITGTAGAGQTLTATYQYNDAEGDTEGSTTLQWLSDGAAISGATSSTYTLTTDDVGAMISFEVTPVAQTGTLVGATATSNGVGPVAANTAPTADSVSISGTTQSGETLTGSYNYDDAEGDAEGTSTFRWLSDGDEISGATSTTYTLTSDDEGSLISFEVTPVAQTGTTAGAAVESNTVGPITEPPPPPPPPAPPTNNDSGGGGSAGLLDIAALGFLGLAGAAARRRRKNGK